MPILLAVALLQSADAVPSSDFSRRVDAARVLETSAAGRAYQTELWSQIGKPMTDALQGCITSNAPADRSPFTLVADVRSHGLPAQIEVNPRTAVAACLSGQFAAWRLPTPPETPTPYLIEIDVSVVR